MPRKSKGSGEQIFERQENRMEFMTGVKEKETVTLADVTAEGMEGKTVKIEASIPSVTWARWLF